MKFLIKEVQIQADSWYLDGLPSMYEVPVGYASTY